MKCAHLRRQRFSHVTVEHGREANTDLNGRLTWLINFGVRVAIRVLKKVSQLVKISPTEILDGPRDQLFVVVVSGLEIVEDSNAARDRVCTASKS